MRVEKIKYGLSTTGIILTWEKGAIDGINSYNADIVGDSMFARTIHRGRYWDLLGWYWFSP
jgi:hypothetical protein